MTSPATAPTAFTAKTILKYKPFRTLWLAQFVSVFGDFLALFAVISLITFRWHGTPVQVTTVTMAFVLPMAVISPIAGVFVDHWNVKRLMIASDLIRAVLILMLVFVHNVSQISAIFLVLSSVSSFFAPAQSVTLRTIVPADGLLAANALMMQAFYIVRLLSPAAAGALVAWLTEKSCFYIDIASFVFSAAMISTLAVIRPARAQGEKTVKSLAQDFLAGNKFIFTHAGLAFVFIAMAVAMFVLSSFSPLISIYIRDSLHAGSFMFGAISAMVGVGMIVGTQLITRLARSGLQVLCGAGRTLPAWPGCRTAGSISQHGHGRAQHICDGFRDCVRLDSRPDHVPAGNTPADGWAREQHLYVANCCVPGIWSSALRISRAKAGHTGSVYHLCRCTCA